MPTSVLALGLILALAPGIIFRWAYISAAMPRRLGTAAASDEVVWVTGGSIATYFALWVIFALTSRTAAGWVWGPHASLFTPRLAHEAPKLLAQLLSSDVKAQAAAMEAILIHAREILLGYLFACAIALILGFVAWKLVRRLQLDLRFNLLRIPNDWFYILSGREFGAEDCGLVFVWALVDVGGVSMIYRGILTEYFPCEAGGLESIALAESERALFKADGVTETFVGIVGDTFVLKYSEIKNLNLQFVYVEEKDVMPAAEALPPADYPLE